MLHCSVGVHTKHQVKSHKTKNSKKETRDTDHHMWSARDGTSSQPEKPFLTWVSVHRDEIVYQPYSYKENDGGV